MNPELIRLIESNEIQIHGDVEYFAELVAAAEREACAEVCEETTAAWTQHLYNSGCVDCAAAIRARGKNANRKTNPEIRWFEDNEYNTE